MTDERKPAGPRATGAGPGLLERFPALGRLRKPSRRLPEVRQLSATDCGAACLAMVLGHYGREVTLESVREVTGTGRDGLSARILLEAGRRLGLRGRAVSTDLDRLSHLPPGSILHWDFNHYVVLEQVHRGQVHILDPAHGRRRISLEGFSRHFTGVVLLILPVHLHRL